MGFGGSTPFVNNNYTSPPSVPVAARPEGLEEERRRLHELLVTTPPEEFVRGLRERLLQEDEAVRLLGELLPDDAAVWPPRWRE